MAEQLNNTTLTADESGTYNIIIREFTPTGQASNFIVPVPSNVDSQTASVMLRAAILKKTTWKAQDMPTILHAILYADRMGLDIIAGDVYMAEEGRISTTAGAKIRHAMASGRIEGYEVEITDGAQTTIPWETRQNKGEYKGPNYKAKVTVHVRGWKNPVVYETTLAEWFVGRNPNWRTRPTYMLRRNALSKALEEVAPMGVEADEAPPAIEAAVDSTKAVAAAKAKVEGAI